MAATDRPADAARDVQTVRPAVIVGGNRIPFARSGGAYVLENVASLEQARAIVAADPLASTGSSDLTIHEWQAR